ncbi:MAG TPA: SRPBCC family protein [Anaerolineales bacterium]|jgi:hypothetical protein|nr:SRPBCC family protein [Anaerolineales bacterium]
MARIESSIIVQESIENVFAFLNKCESHRNFIPRMTALKQTSPGIFGQVGTTLSGMLNYFGIPIPVRYEIIAVEPNQLLAMKGKMGPVLFRDGYALRRNGVGTELKFWLELAPTGWAKLFFPFMGLVGKIHAWETLRNLKRELAEEIATSGRTPSSQ